MTMVVYKSNVFYLLLNIRALKKKESLQETAEEK